MSFHAVLARGNYCEALAVVKLLKNGWEVFDQCGGGSKTDLIARKGKAIVKLQVKSTCRNGKRGKERLSFRSSRGNKNRPRTNDERYYKSEDVDFFICVDRQDNCFIVPCSEQQKIGYPTPDSPVVRGYLEAWHLMEEKKVKFREAA